MFSGPPELSTNKVEGQLICQEREVLFLRHKPPHPDSPSPGNSVGLYLIFGAVNSLISCLGEGRRTINHPYAQNLGKK
jgi:hypothetical protein